MGFPFPGIGVAFDIDALGGAYGIAAWRLFMKRLDPKRLSACIFVEGDTAATLSGEANEFCIGIYGLTLDATYIRDSFETAEEVGFAPMHRRFIEKIVLDQQPLPIAGRMDAYSRFVTDHWIRSFHDICKGSGWGYAPVAVPQDLDSNLRAELERLKTPRFD